MVGSETEEHRSLLSTDAIDEVMGLIALYDADADDVNEVLELASQRMVSRKDKSNVRVHPTQEAERILSFMP